MSLFGNVKVCIETKSNTKRYQQMEARRSMFDGRALDKIMEIVDELNEEDD